MGSKDHSFDIVSQVDLQEVSNAVEQSKNEIATRFVFRDSKRSIDWNKEDKAITLQTENEFRIKAILDILQTRMAKRGVSLKSMERGQMGKASGGTVRQEIKIIQGIPSEKAKEIVKFIKDTKLKIQAQIQQDQVRVQSVKIDNLQEIIRLLRNKDFGPDLQYINYR